MPPTQGQTITIRWAMASCPCCGRIHDVPPVLAGQKTVCTRCETKIEPLRGGSRSAYLTVAIALSALVLYVPAVTLPLLQVERFGHSSESSLLSGVATLLSQGLIGTKKQDIVSGQVSDCQPRRGGKRRHEVIVTLASIHGVIMNQTAQGLILRTGKDRVLAFR